MSTSTSSHTGEPSTPAQSPKPRRRIGMKQIVYTSLTVLIGSLLGIGLYTFWYAKGYAYLQNDPAACAQCHAMNEQYAAWQHSSHKAVAGCNDCHAPHDNIVSKYVNKGENGFWHSLKFTTGDYPENIKIRDHNRQVTEDACLYCHGELVSGITTVKGHSGWTASGEQISCIRCHDGVGHMR